MDNFYLYLQMIAELYPKLSPAMINKDQEELDDLYFDINTYLNKMKKLIAKYTNNDRKYTLSDEQREWRRMNMLKNRRKKKEN